MPPKRGRGRGRCRRGRPRKDPAAEDTAHATEESVDENLTEKAQESGEEDLPEKVLQASPSVEENEGLLVEVSTTTKRPKKRRSIEDPKARLSESMVARTTSRERERRSEEADVAECMALLESDGVEEGSDLQYEALDLFLDPINRYYYKNMFTTPQARVGWLKWQLRKKYRKSD